MALALVLLLAAGAAAVAAPKIAVDSRTYNYPNTVSGIAVIHDFVLSNVGDQDLVFGTVHSTCGCTTTRIGASRLSPGQSVALHVVFDTTEYYGSGIRREITVPSNDPLEPSLTLTLTGTLLAREPYQVTIDGFLRGRACVILDVRDPVSYASGHLLGAMSVPLSQAATLAASLPPSALVYCYDQDGTTASVAAAALLAGGVASASAVCDGIGQWGQRRPWSTLLVSGADASWGRFLDVSGARGRYAGSSVSCTSMSLTSGTKYYVLIDLRSSASFAERHLAGAINMTESSAMSFAYGLPADVPVIVYSEDGVAGDRVAESLSSRGRPVTSLLGGLAEWQKVEGNFLLVASVP